MNENARERLICLLQKEQRTRNMSQRELAKEFGISYTAIQNWYNRTHFPSVLSLEKIAKATGQSHSDLMEYLEGAAQFNEDTIIRQLSRLPKASLAKVMEKGLEYLTVA
ncbi:helix-turn-helix transcriptional regulator [Synechococcus sp. PCC 6312]|uniref:helix-turn-helix transcriptional regulator n=1 Tax=Synechococcus sp. (strain ATCC 27167 / PCC 6312) TaxID=195253 RepID=UPI00155ADCFE|nr:helix-turn-helix transcriptional regulator [Synechococcus sp. PCC 6312]